MPSARAVPSRPVATHADQDQIGARHLEWDFSSCTRSTVRCSAFFLVLTLPYWLLQMMRHGKYRAGLRQRFGAVPPALASRDARPTIWVHAVSVGEVVASSAVIEALRQKFPSHRVLISTTTSTGQKLAAQRFGAENVFYFPLDFALRHPALSRCIASGTVRDRGNGILAELSAAGQAQRGAHRRDQLPNFRPLVSRLQAASVLASGLLRRRWRMSIFSWRKPKKTGGG